jgi:transposase
MWYAGIDWADTKHDVVVIDEAGRKVASLRVEHTASGLNKLIRFLRGIAPLDQIACILETKHGLLITALLEAGIPLYPVNPKTIDRKRVASRAKTDQIDAYLLAKHGRSELADLRRLEPDSPKIAELKALTRDQDSLIVSQTRLVNQLTACLKAYYPSALSLFSKLQQPSTLAFLQAYPTPEEARKATVDQVGAVLKKAKHPSAEQVAPKIYEQLHQPQLEADPITVSTKSRLMVALVAQLSPLLPQIAAYDKEIERLFLTHEDKDVFESLPGAGKRLTSRLLAEWELCHGASTLCLHQAAAQGPVSVCLAEYATGTVGGSLLRAQTKGGKEPQHGHSRAGKRLGTHPLCHVVQGAGLPTQPI